MLDNDVFWREITVTWNSLRVLKCSFPTKELPKNALTLLQGNYIIMQYIKMIY